MEGEDLSVAVQHNTESTTPGVLVLPGHPAGCTCNDHPDIQLVLAGGMTLKQTLELAKKIVLALSENTIEDPLTGELHTA